MPWNSTFRRIFLNLSKASFTPLHYRKVKNWLRKLWGNYQYTKSVTPEMRDEETKTARRRQNLKRWEADYQLEAMDRLHLFDEYIEISEE